ncbi:unnamed protein product [Vitrella brassicaformis CCMP3155]|uniref:Sugar phosphate transporter domain-containing protein n=1 Tax=Vitrella brassicaformis (strain CCMP3155) TaxID=1169540 RepID=A0A0G4H444_VITBC|nr:unnamed protein product [Vitrella brassicaformis CCMP3155]|eukprot:CEM38521.1 unnamed protein product [Vitrella brassicaformis CCMP3155]
MATPSGGVQASVFQDKTLLLFLVLFAVAYCSQPLLVDAVKYQGAASASTFLYLIPHYLSMSLVGFLPDDERHTEEETRKNPWLAWKKAGIISAIDIAHQLTEKAGLVFAGSAVYIVVGSSTIVWTAIMVTIVNRRRLAPAQWFSIALICAGISVKAFSIDFDFHNDEFVGAVLTLGAAILQGLTFAVNERFLTGPGAVSGPKLVAMMGIINLALLVVWTAVWTVPQFDKLVLSNIRRHNGHTGAILMGFLGLFLCGFVHSATLWYLIKKIGAVSSGVMKGLKTASVFVLSHYFFCSIQSSQCLTPTKAISAAVCVLGVLLYSICTPPDAAAARAAGPPPPPADKTVKRGDSKPFRLRSNEHLGLLESFADEQLEEGAAFHSNEEGGGQNSDDTGKGEAGAKK